MSDLQTDQDSGQSKADPKSTGGATAATSLNQSPSAGGVSTPGSAKLGTPGKRPTVQFSPTAGYTPGTSSTSKRRKSCAVETHSTVSLNEAIAFDASFEEDDKGHKEHDSGAPSTVARLSPPTVARPFASEHVSQARLCEKGSEATHPGVLSHDTGEQEDDDAGPPGITATEPGAPAYSPPRASPPCENLSLNKLVANRAVGFSAVDSRVMRHEKNPAQTTGGYDTAVAPTGATAANAPAPAAASPTGFSFRSPYKSSSPTAAMPAVSSSPSTSSVSSKRLEAAANWGMCFRNGDPASGVASVPCSGFVKQFSGMEHVIEDLQRDNEALAKALATAEQALVFSQQNEQRSLAMATIAARSPQSPRSRVV